MDATGHNRPTAREAQMTSTTRSLQYRSTLGATGLALLALACLGGPVSSQSPAVPASAAPGASQAAAGSAAPVDVASLRWKQSKRSKGFGPRDGSPLVFDMAVSPTGRFLLVGVDSDITPKRRAVVWGSDDGVRWAKLKGSVPKGSAAAAIVPTEDGFLIAGDVNGAGPLLLSSDGTRVAALDAPVEALPTGPLYALARTPVGLVAAGADSRGAATMWTSADGRSWTGTPLPEALYAVHVAVADDGTIVALGIHQEADGARTPTTWTSTDGTTWTAAALPVEPASWSVPDLEATPLGLVAAISQGGGAGVAFLSRDGITWTQVLETPGVVTVGTAGAEAVLFGPDTWWHSADGTTWTEAATKSFDGYRIETSAVRPDGAVIAAGYLRGPMTAPEPVDATRTWVGGTTVPEPSLEPEPSRPGG
jgi:hypothetical protein